MGGLFDKDFFPYIRDPAEAQRACRDGAIAAGIIVVLKLLFWWFASLDVAALADVAIFCGVAFGFLKSSRVAAVAGTLLLAVSILYGLWSLGGPLSRVVIAIVFSVPLVRAFTRGLCGAFAVHRLASPRNGPPRPEK